MKHACACLQACSVRCLRLTAIIALAVWGRVVAAENGIAEVALFSDTTSFLAGNGIACISMGLVDGCGNPVTLLNCPRPSPVAHIELLGTFDFQSLTRTERYYMSPESARKPGNRNYEDVCKVLIIRDGTCQLIS